MKLWELSKHSERATKEQHPRGLLLPAKKTSIVGDCGANCLEILAQICCNDSKQIFDFDPNLAVYEM